MFETGLKQNGNVVFIGDTPLRLEVADMRALVDKTSDEVDRDPAHIVFRYDREEPQHVYETLHKRIYAPVGAVAFACESIIAKEREHCDKLLPHLRRAEMSGRLVPYICEIVAIVANAQAACQQDIAIFEETKRLCSLIPPMTEPERLLWWQVVSAMQAELAAMFQRMPSSKIVAELSARIAQMPADKGRALLQACRQSLLPLDQADIDQIANSFAQAHYPQIDEMIEQAKLVQRWAQARTEMDLEAWFSRLPYGLTKNDIISAA